jgi:serine/threonine protein kinase
MDLRCFLLPATLEKARQQSTTKEYTRFTDVIFRVRDRQVCIQPGVVIHILRQVLRALETLHGYGFVHSDIKPANIMLDRLGNARVIDYGRAARIRERVNILLGTPHYMAPETHRREPSLVQTDLYSVGLLGIEMLIGRPVVRGRTERELLAAKLELPGQLEKILPRHVLDSVLFTRMLRNLVDPDPQNRFESARDAEAGTEGLGALHRELIRMRVDADYERELEQFLTKVLEPRSKQVDM